MKYVRQGKTNPVWFHLYVESKKQMNKDSKTETDIEDKKVVARAEETPVEEREVREIRRYRFAVAKQLSQAWNVQRGENSQ